MESSLYVTLYRACYLYVDHKIEQIAKDFAHSCVSFRTCQDDDMQHVIRIIWIIHFFSCVLGHGLKVRISPNTSNELRFRLICFCLQTDPFCLLVSSFPSRPPSPSEIPWLPDIRASLPCIPTICEIGMRLNGQCCEGWFFE